DAHTHRVIARLHIGERFIYALRFSPDGRLLYAVIGNPAKGDTTVGRFDPRTGRPLGPEVVAGPNLGTLMLTRDGRRAVTTVGEGPTVIRDARSLRPLNSLPVGAETAALSPNDRTILFDGDNGSVRFVDLVTNKTRKTSERHDGTVTATAFTPDGTSAITAGQD